MPGQTTRPITDRVKEALFNILAGEVEDAVMLDLFGGTGAVGIEALSRGAREVWFVDKEWKAIQTIKVNLKTTGFLAQAKVIRQDAFKFLRQMAGTVAFDIVYVAPPQYQGLWAKALAELDDPGVLEPGALAIAQIHPKEFLELSLQRLVLVDKRKYGSTILCFYRVRESEDSAADGGAAS